MKSKCNRCGECCRVIGLIYTKKHLRKKVKSPDVKFILEHWRRIGKKEAYKRQPILKKEDWSGHYFYVCDAWDEKTHLCKMHKLRPEVCRGYPFYGRKPTYSEWLEIRNCGYAQSLLAKAMAQSVDN